MKHKIRGFIEPFSLGILISLIATGALFAVGQNQEAKPLAHSEVESGTTASSTSKPDGHTGSATGTYSHVD